MGVSRDFCAERSATEGEPLAGTAERVDVWVMLEHRPVWTARAIETATLASEDRAWLGGVQRAVEAAGLAPRLQLIRQPGREGDRTLFVHVANAGLRTLYRFEESEGGLRAVDVAELIARPQRFTHHQVTSPYYFVCTNGQRDQCCARFGLPTFAALCERVGERAWQTTHLGGHRFAPNVLVLPAGEVYGRLPPPLIGAFVDACERGTALADFLRGRSWRPPAVQAAESHVLRETGQLPDGAADVGERADGSVRVAFSASQWVVELRVGRRDRITSCGEIAPKPVLEWSLVSCRREQARRID